MPAGCSGITKAATFASWSRPRGIRPDCGRRVARPAQAPSDPGGAEGIAMVVACVGTAGMIAAHSLK